MKKYTETSVMIAILLLMYLVNVCAEIVSFIPKKFELFSFFKKYLFLFGCIGSQLQHVGSSSLTRDRTQAPCIGSAVLATGPPGNSLNFFLDVNVCFGIFCLTGSLYCSQIRSFGILNSAYFFVSFCIILFYK